MSKVTIGCDPELFVFRGETPVSAHDLIPGSKHNPCTVKYGAVQVDGVAGEFNIEPAKTRKEFLRNIKNVRRILDKILANRDDTLCFRAVPSVTFDQAYFDDLPPEVKALGCEPDFDAYTEKANPKPETKKPFRTGSGHIHVGWDDCDTKEPGYVQKCFRIVKELDFTLYRSSLLWDNDQTRRELYGKPGSMRFKPYGLEYRPLSNVWLEDEGLMSFVFDMTKSVATRVLKGETFSDDYKGNIDTSTEYHKFLCRRRLPSIHDYYAA